MREIAERTGRTPARLLPGKSITLCRGRAENRQSQAHRENSTVRITQDDAEMRRLSHWRSGTVAS